MQNKFVNLKVGLYELKFYQVYNSFRLYDKKKNIHFLIKFSNTRGHNIRTLIITNINSKTLLSNNYGKYTVVDVFVTHTVNSFEHSTHQ